MITSKSVFSGLLTVCLISAVGALPAGATSVPSTASYQSRAAVVSNLSKLNYKATYRSLVLAAGLVDSVQNTTDINRKYTLSADEMVTANLGALETEGARLDIIGNGFGIIGNGSVSGIKVFGTNTLAVSGVGSLGSDGSVLSAWTGFKNSDGGGAIHSFGNLLVKNSVFSANIANHHNYNGGGAIYTEGKADVSGSAFVGNKSSNGGAIFNEGDGYNQGAGELKVANSVFKNNSADQGTKIAGGGAIYNSGKLKVADSQFDGNTSNVDGGAIYTEGNATVAVSNAEFTNNIASQDGGAFAHYGGDSVLSDVTFKNNTANIQGGALYARSGTVVLNKGTFDSNGVFSDNSRTQKGGAVYSEAEITLNDSSFINNKALKGGALFLMNGGSINGGSFTHNEATEYGGAIYSSTMANGPSAIFNGVNVTNNKGAQGGGFFIAGGTSVLNAVTLQNNIAQSGGAAYLNYAGALEVNNMTVSGNEAIYGGAFFNDNEGFYDSGSDFLALLRVNDVNISGNKAERDGGALYADMDSKNKIINSVFDGNQAGLNGGAIANIGGTVDIVNSSFLNNTAGETGGAIYTEGIVNILADKGYVEFSGNTANGQSEAIYAQPGGFVNFDAINGGTIRVNDKIASGDSSFGGEIYVNNSYLNSDPFDPAPAVSYGNVIFNNTVHDISLYMMAGTLKLGEFGNTALVAGDKYLQNVNVTLTGGVLDSANGVIDQMVVDGWESSSDAKLSFDVDLDKGLSDEYELGWVSGGSSISLGSVNVIADGLAGNVRLFSGSSDAPSLSNGVAYTAQNKYVLAQNADDLGLLDVTTEGVSNGFHAAVTEDEGLAKSFSAAGEVNAEHDLGVVGGPSLTVHGNQNGINGSGYAGFEVGSGTNLSINNIGNTDVDGQLLASINGFVSQRGGAVSNDGGTLNVHNSIISANESKTSGGAIHHASGETTVTDTSFTDNKAAQDGGAIYNADGTVVINAATKDIVFSGNTVNGQGNDIHLGNALTRAGSSAVVTLTGAKNITLNGGISGDGTLNKQGSGTVFLGGQNSSFTGDFNLDQGTVQLLSGASYFAAAATSLADGVNLSFANNEINDVNLGATTVNGDAKLGLDVDLANGESDKVDGTSFAGTGHLVISNINLMSDASSKNILVDVVGSSLAANAKLDEALSKVLGPIYSYGVSYNPLTGQLGFSGVGGTTSSGYNPAVLAGSVAASAGTYLAHAKSYDAALENISAYPVLPESKDREFWFKPYGDFNDVDLKNGPTVDVRAYGGLLGVDTYSRAMLFGLDGYYSAYAGYMGATEKYDGIKIEQNGGLAGVGVTMYGDYFFTALTLNGGVADNRAKTMYGKEDFSSYSAGAAWKTGYNLDLPFYCATLQPSVLLSYTFVDTEDYTNAAQVRIKGDSMNVFQAAPGLKLIGDYVGGWQPSLEARMVWSDFDSSAFQADSVTLPSLSVGSYAEYGGTIAKVWTNGVGAYASLMGRSGGISGISARMGVKVAL